MDADNKDISISVFPVRQMFPSAFGKTYSWEILKKKKTKTVSVNPIQRVQTYLCIVRKC